MFFIPNDILGTEFSIELNSDGTYKKFVKENSNPNLINVKSKAFIEKSILYGLEIPSFPPEKYKKPYSSLLKKGYKIPWIKCIPKEIYKKELQTYFNKLLNFNNIDFSYYENFFQKGERIFSGIAPAAIDLAKFNDYLNEEQILSTKKTLVSFTPIKEESKYKFTDLPQYSRIRTKTGRLVISKGPQILHLKTDYRDIISSSFEGGEVYYFDFKSLEPRVLLAKKYPTDILPKDIYQYAIEKLGLDTDRKHVKIALISTINGAGEKEVSRQLQGKVDYPEEFIKVIKEYFGIEELREELLEQYSKNQSKMILNAYGRPIFCPNTAPYILLNYYIQSTAVDIALMGFSKIWAQINKIGMEDFCKPLFVLHDALIMDLHPKMEPYVEKIANFGTKIPLFSHTPFWIEVTKLK